MMPITAYVKIPRGQAITCSTFKRVCMRGECWWCESCDRSSGMSVCLVWSYVEVNTGVSGTQWI